MNAPIAALVLPLLLAAASGATAATIRVGPGEQAETLAAAARLAQNGDVVEIPSGDYRGDVAVWTQDDLTIRGVGESPPRLIAMGAAAEGKAIFVVRGGRVRIENIEFRDAKVRDRNGAGIRLERGSLTVARCRFINNENGILTSGAAGTTLAIGHSEFGYNGAGDGQSHNLYVGSIDSLTVTGSYFHHARVGHLIKSRARENRIFYNRLTDETGGRASYELEFPSGGQALVVGNIIQQSATTENFTIISMGAEGTTRWPLNTLTLSHNTIVNDRKQGARMLDAKPGVQVLAINNLLTGQHARLEIAEGSQHGTVVADIGEFVRPVLEDYRLINRSRLVGSAARTRTPLPSDLFPTAEYLHPLQIRPLAPRRWSPGALQSTGD